MEEDLGASTGSREPDPQAVPALSGFDPERNGYVLFSVRDKISRAIADPGLYFERIRTDDGMVETLDHWQARAAIEAMMQCAASSPSFALAIGAAIAESSPAPHTK